MSDSWEAPPSMEGRRRTTSQNRYPQGGGRQQAKATSIEHSPNCSFSLSTVLR